LVKHSTKLILRMPAAGEPIFGNRKICGKYAATIRMVLKISCVQQIVATTPLLRG